MGRDTADQIFIAFLDRLEPIIGDAAIQIGIGDSAPLRLISVVRITCPTSAWTGHHQREAFRNSFSIAESGCARRGKEREGLSGVSG